MMFVSMGNLSIYNPPVVVPLESGPMFADDAELEPVFADDAQTVRSYTSD